MLNLLFIVYSFSVQKADKQIRIYQDSIYHSNRNYYLLSFYSLNNYVKNNFRPYGQAVKTTPFHGVIMGSIPVRVILVKNGIC